MNKEYMVLTQFGGYDLNSGRSIRCIGTLLKCTDCYNTIISKFSLINKETEIWITLILEYKNIKIGSSI